MFERDDNYQVLLKKLRDWKRRLLDLSRRNPQIYYNPLRKRRVEIVAPSAEILFGKMLADESMKFIPVYSPTPEETEGLKEEERREHIKRQHMQKVEALRSDLPPFSLITNQMDEDLRRQLKRLNARNQTMLRDRGIHVMYLAFGLLKWKEPDKGKVNFSPLVFVQVELLYNRPYQQYSLRLKDEDETVVNESLSERLKLDYGVKLPPFMEGDTYRGYVEKIRAHLEKAPGMGEWEIMDKVFLDLFSFSRISLYKEMDELDVFANHPIVRRLAMIEKEPIVLQKIFEGDLVRMPSYSRHIVLDADSSQMIAIHNALEGKSMVIRGPPGTGKSQTIANIIAEFIARDKRVLFVSQKMAALKVVKSRLDQVNLGHFCLELHSHLSNKKEVLDTLARVERLAVNHPPISDDIYRALDRTMQKMEAYLERIGRRGMIDDWTLYDMIGMYSELEHYDDFELRVLRVPRSKTEMMSIFAAARDYSSTGYVNDQENLFKDLGIKYFREMDAKAIVKSLEALFQRLGHTLNSIDAFKREYGVAFDVGQMPRKIVVSDRICTIHGKMEGIRGSIKNEVSYDFPVVSLERLGDYHQLLEELKTIQGDLREILPLVEKLRDKRVETAQLVLEFIRDNPFKPEQLVADITQIIENEEKYQGISRFFKPAYYRHWRYMRRVFPERNVFSKLKNEMERLGIEKLELNFLQPEFEEKAKRVLKRIEGGISLEKIGIPYRIQEERGLPSFFDRVGKLSNLFESYLNLYQEMDALFNELEGYFPISREIALNDVEEFVKEMERFVRNGQELMQEIEMTKQSLREFQEHVVLMKRRRVETILNKDYHELLSEALNQKSFFMDTVKHFKAKWLLSDYFGSSFETYSPKNENLEPIIKKRVFEDVISSIIQSDEILQEMVPNKQDMFIKWMREGDQKTIRMNQVRIILDRLERKEKKREMMNLVKTSEQSILRRETLKKRRIRPLREIFSLCKNYITSLTPCFLMSPLSIATYLPCNEFNSFFDVVIFDEASQVTPEDAIGAITRGKQVIMVGDEKQMPPTSFFRTMRDNDEEEDEEYYHYESILEEFLGAGIPETMLKWHYRSRRENLITFSNYHYYDSQLVTFPDPYREGKGRNEPSLRFIYVDGIYDKGGKRVNHKEAEIVVDHMIAHLKSCKEKGEYYSLGVIAFNLPQTELIQDLFDTRLEEEGELQEYYFSLMEENEEEIIIKSLENMQGDERDFIFLSVGYGPDRDGKMSLNFGPINRKGGERRLNVAITRARYHNRIFASFDPLGIDDSSSSSKGLKQLITYMKFAKTGNMSMLKPEGFMIEIQKSKFVSNMASRLQKMGYEVETYVGNAAYRVHIAIVNKKQPDKYIVGIECDDPSYLNSRFPRDRDKIRPSFLESLGWNMYHLWSTDWFTSKEETLKKLVDFIEKAGSKKEDKVPNNIGQNNDKILKFIEKTRDQKPQKSLRTILFEMGRLQTYQRFQSNMKYHRDLFFERQMFVKDIIRKIISIEQPIHRNVIMKRMMEIFDIKRKTKRFLGTLTSYLASISGYSDFYGKWDGKVRFAEHVYENITEVFPEEVKKSILIIIDTVGGMISRKELIKHSSQIFGVKLSPKTRQYYEELMNEMETNRKILVKDDIITLPNP